MNALIKDDGNVFDAKPRGCIAKNGFLKWMKSFVDRVQPTKESPLLLFADGKFASSATTQTAVSAKRGQESF